jgi:hypothetical protein
MARAHGWCDAHWSRVKNGIGLQPEMPIRSLANKKACNRIPKI